MPKNYTHLLPQPKESTRIKTIGRRKNAPSQTRCAQRSNTWDYKARNPSYGKTWWCEAPHSFFAWILVVTGGLARHVDQLHHTYAPSIRDTWGWVSLTQSTSLIHLCRDVYDNTASSSGPTPTHLPYAASRLFRAPFTSRSSTTPQRLQAYVLLPPRSSFHFPQWPHVLLVPGSSINNTSRPM
jgi:hypothetical protein